MLDVYLDTLIIGQIICNVLNRLNELKLRKEIFKIGINNVFLDKNRKATTKQKIKHKIPRESRELNPGHLARLWDALPLVHRVN